MDQFEFVGETLRRLRKERGKTLEGLGREASLGRGQLSRIENGHQQATLATLEKILESQGVTRREFFRRYDLVESEALANLRSEAVEKAGEGSPASGWPAEVQEVLSKVESFVQVTLHQPRPVAQGAIELGDFVVLFRVVPKNAPEAQPAREREPPPPASPKRKKKR